MGTILSSMKLITPIRVRYETEPLPNTTCSNWRRDGYARQQYSNFYADLYTDADYVGIIDSDAGFITPGKSLYIPLARSAIAPEVSLDGACCGQTRLPLALRFPR